MRRVAFGAVLLVLALVILIASRQDYDDYRYDRICDGFPEDVCDRIQPYYMKSYFYGECRAVAEDASSYCELLLQDADPDYREEQVGYCRKNLNLFRMLRNKDEDYCASLENETYKIFHSYERDNELCMRLHEGNIEGYTESTAESMCMRLFGERRFLYRCMSALLQDASYCRRIASIDDRIKCLIYAKEIDCERLDDREYIGNLIEGTTHFTEE